MVIITMCIHRANTQSLAVDEVSHDRDIKDITLF